MFVARNTSNRARRGVVLTVAIVLITTCASTVCTRAFGAVAMETSFGRVVPAMTTAATQRAVLARPPLRFTIIDAAGAAIHRWPGGPVAGVLSTTSPLGYHSWAWALSTTQGRWARIVLPWPSNAAGTRSPSSAPVWARRSAGHLPDGSTSPIWFQPVIRQAHLAGSPSVFPVTSRTCPTAGQAATNSQSTGRMTRRRSARPLPPAASACQHGRSRSCDSTFASARRS
jgi:hypothetical protein